VAPGGCMEARDDVFRFDAWVGIRAQEQAGVVIDQVENLRVLTISKLPVGDIGLPHLIR
jgi:hypothetical protein